MSFGDNLLKRSSSYNFYKHEYKKLSNENQKLVRKNDELMQNFEKLQSQNKELIKVVSELNKGFNHYSEFFNDKFNKINHDFVERDNFQRVLNKEIQYAFIFNDTIKDSEWLKNKNFSLINAAANYSLMYLLYRVLDETKPINILELGLGQTTKLTTQYADFFKDAKLTVLEGDQTWIDSFSKNLVNGDNVDIVNMDLEIIEYNNSETIRFKNVSDIVKDNKFDLIIIDGPQGFIPDSDRDLEYSRTNVWELIPDNLSDDFVIIMDDYNRNGEMNTISHVKELLNENNIAFYEYNSWAYKSQHAIFSEKFKYVSWF